MEVIRSMIPSDLNHIREFRDGVIFSAEEKIASEDFIFRIKLILDELIVNSYKHGNNYENDKMIEAVIVIDRDFCSIKIKDEGEGIDYKIQDDYLQDHGRGIKLVFALADKILIKDNVILALLMNDSSVNVDCNAW